MPCTTGVVWDLWKWNSSLWWSSSIFSNYHHRMIKVEKDLTIFSEKKYSFNPLEYVFLLRFYLWNSNIRFLSSFETNYLFIRKNWVFQINPKSKISDRSDNKWPSFSYFCRGREQKKVKKSNLVMHVWCIKIWNIFFQYFFSGSFSTFLTFNYLFNFISSSFISFFLCQHINRRHLKNWKTYWQNIIFVLRWRRN